MTIDHLMTFPNQANAIADPVVGQYYTPASNTYSGGWRGDVCIPNIFIWDKTLDTTNTNSFGQTYVIHTPYDSNWRILIMLPTATSALTSLPTCHLVINRETGVVLQSVLTPTQLNNLGATPIPMGANYPFGNV